MLRLLSLLALTAALAAPSAAQVQRDYLRLDGPRFGFTYLPQGTVDQINEAFGETRAEIDPETGQFVDGTDEVIGAVPVVTQFGWQFERRFFQTESGVAGVTEWIPLVGGLERGVFLPSLTFLVGLRGPSGVELGVGPNLSGTGPAYAVAAGVNNDLGGLNVPLNVAAVFGQDGVRGSVLVGFNLASNGARRAVPPARPRPPATARPPYRPLPPVGR